MKLVNCGGGSYGDGKGNINSGIVEVSFAPGEEVKLLKEWKDETCLVKKGDQVFNIPKKYLNLS
jgi:hypothetical protein